VAALARAARADTPGRHAGGWPEPLPCGRFRAGPRFGLDLAGLVDYGNHNI
jgi:hypothetical protein